jgi:bifunctional DNA-binding transcriptional regulator/antitoxin component of YhaV-PrlF toxin-antitoxin module
MDRYDITYDPPAPIAEIKISKPFSLTFVPLKGKIDSGADKSVIPDALREIMDLKPGKEIIVKGYDGRTTSKPTYYITVLLKEFRFVIDVLSSDRKEMLIDRDIINNFKLLLDGKNKYFVIMDP